MRLGWGPGIVSQLNCADDVVLVEVYVLGGKFVFDTLVVVEFVVVTK